MILGNVEIEKSLISAIFLKPECIWLVIPIINNGDPFTSHRHRIIYNEMVDMLDSGGIIDLSLLQDRLIRSDMLGRVGGIEYINEILNSVGMPQHAEAYAKEIRDYYVARSMMFMAEELKETSAVDEMIDTVESGMAKVSKIMDHGGEKRNSTVLKDILTELDSGIVPRLSSGYKNIDDLIIGYDPGDMIILGGRPSMGKTTLAMNMISNLCRDGKSVLFFSLEMTSKDIMMNMLAHRAMVNTYNLRNGSLTDTDYEKIVSASREIAKYNMIVNDFRGHTVSTIRAKAKTIHCSTPIDLIVIDHMSKINTTGKSESETLRISKISNKLCQLAGELNVPIMCLHQLNRGIESRDNKKPRLSDLRQSGEIEQDADIVMFVYRESYYERDNRTLDDCANVIVAKNRKGRTGEISLACDLKIATFYDHEPLGPTRI